MMPEHNFIPATGMIVPFLVLLGFTAIAPLVSMRWWLAQQLKVIGGLSAIILFYYLFQLRAFGRTVETAEEYFGFITLIGSLYVVAGGLHLKVKGRAGAGTNTLFLLGGAVLANFVGTTGASMILIRPWLRLNKQRLALHQVVFFIFIVSNVGGCLTPIGDPPLYLAFLQGIPFWWFARECWAIWLVGIGMLLAMFYLKERFHHAKGNSDAIVEIEQAWQFSGGGNLLFLAVILVAVFLPKPHFLREGLFIIAALGSYFTTAKKTHAANGFDLHPLKEIALVFAGIFITMMPALDWLAANAGAFGSISAGGLFWSCGAVSSGLDNAPTFLCFFKAYASHFVAPELVQNVQHAISDPNFLRTLAHPEATQQALQQVKELWPTNWNAGTLTANQIETAVLIRDANLKTGIVAISIGAVFFGAFTYIANGPNLLVQAIARQQNARTPNFLEYIWRFALPYLLPMLLVIWWLFFPN